MPSEQGLIIPGDRDFRVGPAEVNRLHDYDDVDVSLNSHHHTIGSLPTQAASGSHKHATVSRGENTGQVAPTGNDIPVVFTEAVKSPQVKWGVFGGNTGAQLQVDGIWLIHFHWIRSAGGLGARNWLRLKSSLGAPLDGAGILSHVSILPTVEDRYSIDYSGYLPKSAVIRFEFFQDSGGSTTCAGTASVIYLGR